MCLLLAVGTFRLGLCLHICAVASNGDMIFHLCNLRSHCPPSTLLSRHHTNPVGTEWRWKMDDPEFIVNGAMKNHYEMIKAFKGVLF